MADDFLAQARAFFSQPGGDGGGGHESIASDRLADSPAPQPHGPATQPPPLRLGDLHGGAATTVTLPHVASSGRRPSVGSDGGALAAAAMEHLRAQVAEQRARAEAAESRCIALEAALERYSHQGATLEVRGEGPGPG